MVFDDFSKLISDYKWADYVGLEDYADKLSFNVSTSILLFFTLVVVTKSYLFTAIACFIPIQPSGKRFDDFLNNFCWVHGTIPMYNEEMPRKQSEWEELDRVQRITYYQWVPFILGLQAVLFYLPRILWQIISCNMSGADLQSLVELANSAVNKKREEREDNVKQVAENLHILLFGRRRLQLPSQSRVLAGKSKSNCLMGKRSGRRLLIQYLLVKLLYLANVVGQLMMMQYFLGFGHGGVGFGYVVLNNIMSGREWNDTMVFPRIGYCWISRVEHAGMSNDYLAQCSLPINMLNEKIFVFLWFWHVIVTTFTVISLVQWLCRFLNVRSKDGFLQRFLRVKQINTIQDRNLLHQFRTKFLHGDGVFILRMLALNAGDLITSDIIAALWAKYKESPLLPPPPNPDEKSISSDASTIPLKSDFL